MSTALTAKSIKWGWITTLLTLCIVLMLSNIGQVSAKPQDFITQGLRASNGILIDTPIGAFETKIGRQVSGEVLRRLKRSAISPVNNGLGEMKILPSAAELHTQPQYRHIQRDKRSPCHGSDVVNKNDTKKLPDVNEVTPSPERRRRQAVDAGSNGFDKFWDQQIQGLFSIIVSTLVSLFQHVQTMFDDEDA